ncbi:MAG: polymer-forming cytoskeletal protein [Gracilibacteraceae bacterium]|jgi:cytoskeletal protein CcmA (bactofilin family)|nr:polymer-forming cytoskeletal protein [Gracilibacteraceae bacterium]
MFGKKKDNALIPANPTVTQTSKDPSFIAHDCFIEGVLQSNGDLRIDGRVTGTIRVAGSLVLNNTAYVSADIFAKNVKIAGELRGNISAEELAELTATARVFGDIMAGAFKVERGARFVGASLGQYVTPSIEGECQPADRPDDAEDSAGAEKASEEIKW